MATFRIEKNRNFTVMSNYHLRDKNISLKAKGLLSFMLSLPEEWDYSIKGLVSCLKENEKAVKSGLDELKEAGYLKINKVRNEKGLFEYEYLIFEEPQIIDESIEEESEEIVKEILENQEIIEKNPEYQNGMVDSFHPDPHYPPLEHPPLDDGVQINTNIININNKYIDRWIDNYNIINNIHACARNNINKYNNILKEYEVFIEENVRYMYSKEAINEAIIKQLVLKRLIEMRFDMTLLNPIKLNNCYSKMMQHEIKDNPVNYLVEIIKNKVEREVIQYAG